MAKTVGDVLVDTLIEWGVDTIFGIPGDGINGVFESLRQRQKEIRFIQTRHEESAAFMACAYAKFTGKLGACIATSGPGAIHLLNGLYDAKLDGQSVIAITGMPYHDLIDTHTQQDVRVDRLFEDVCVYNVRVMGPAHVHNVTHIACRAALAYRGVSHVTIPVDIQSMEVTKSDYSKHEMDVENARLALGRRIPDEPNLKHAAEILNRGKKIAILAGRGALGATDELEALAEKLGAPIIKALLGKCAVPDDSPYTTGGIGLLGTRPSQDAIESCDTLFMIGTNFPYLEFMPKPDQAKCVQLDIDELHIGLRYPVDAALIGDAKRSLQLLLPMLQRHEDRSFLETAQRGMQDWWKTIEDRAMREASPMKPQTIAWELGKRLPDNAIVCCDSGTIATWFAREIKAQRGQMMSLSGMLASMANGMPYAIAAALAHPDRPVYALVGDGGFSMLMGEMATCVKYNLNVKIVVVKNNTLGQIKWEQMVFEGNPEYGVELEPIDFAAIARAFGAAGFSVEDSKDVPHVLDAALNTPGPVVVEAVVDPFEPPLPAKITPKQAAKFAESLIRGEPNRTKIAVTALGSKLRELI